jgi:aspartyl-tRNA(Asn)/glutamyl-tRNA(Gln) amidotransferase subunit A
MSSLADSSAIELLALYASGEASPLEAVQDCLARMDDVEPSINAVLTTLAEQATRAAVQSEKRWRDGNPRPMEGVPYGLKDIISTRGILSTGGSSLYKDNVPNEDAVLAERLAGAGGILLAKLHTFEFACGGAVNKTFGIARNPWDTERTTGGSSSGSGGAVSSGEVPLAIGTDTGGSIRIPCAYNGITGIKPTFGRVPRHGVMGLSWTLDHAGPMTRTVEDAALMLGVIAGRDPKDPTSFDVPVADYVAAASAPIEGMRVARARGWLEDVIHPALLANFEDAMATLVDEGVEVVDVEIPNIDLAATAAWTVMHAEMLSLHAGHFDKIEDRDEMGAGLLAAAPFVSAYDYLAGLRFRPLFQKELESAMAGCDALATPTTVSVAPRLDDMLADVGDQKVDWLLAALRTNIPFNFTGSPALVLPMGLVDGMPTSLQLVGRPFDEATLFALGSTFQEATEHHLLRPPLLKQVSTV